MKTINCKGKLIDLSTPKVMGILNITPDSFYDGGKLSSKIQILRQAEKMLTEGATFLDIGGYSSRPGASPVSETEELDRILPVVKIILKEFPNALLSIDTFRSSIAKACVEEGTALINDISAGNLDEKMLDVVANLQVPYIMMHMRGTPQTMMQNTKYDTLTKDILYYFSEKIALARSKGIIDIIIDPGFGFSKTIEQNFELGNHLELLESLDAPVLIGISRKSMIYKTIGITAKEALNGTTALHSILLQKGAAILRVHDVKEAKECIVLSQKILEY